MAKHKLRVEFPKMGVGADVELDDAAAPKTVRAILEKLPIKVEINRWGEELYTDPMPVQVKERENSKSLVELMDVAYWPDGQALCLFFGPTPVSGPNEIKPYSPVNVIGKVLGGKDVLALVRDSTPVKIRHL